MPRWTDERLAVVVASFVASTTDLRIASYGSMASIRKWPSSTTIIKRFGATNLADAIAPEVRRSGDPTASYRWSTCPARRKHANEVALEFTIDQYESGVCPVCEAISHRYAERLAALPPFAELHPYAVRYLTDPAQRNQRGGMVAFTCTTCGADNTPWSPSPTGEPRCHYCRTVNGTPPGGLIPRHGGGEPVQLESAIAAVLRETHGVDVRTDLGIVIPQRLIVIDGAFGAYPLPAIKPDFILVGERVAIELDQRGRGNNHAHAAHVRQDVSRDLALAAVGWRCLRIRQPDMPTIASWPWRIETNSTSSTVIANAVMKALDDRR